MIQRLTLGLVLATALAACGGGGGSSSAFDGIYTLSSWTENPDSCDTPGGPSGQAGGNTHFFVRADNFFGETIMNAIMCEDIETCRTKGNDRDTIYIGQFYFEDGNDSDGWTSSISYLFPPDCDGTVGKLELTGVAGTSVSIRKEDVTVTGIGMDGEDCDEVEAEDQAASKPCESLELVEGAFVEAL